MDLMTIDCLGAFTFSFIITRTPPLAMGIPKATLGKIAISKKK
jgi:hypothetical protein